MEVKTGPSKADFVAAGDWVVNANHITAARHDSVTERGIYGECATVPRVTLYVPLLAVTGEPLVIHVKGGEAIRVWEALAHIAAECESRRGGENTRDAAVRNVA